MASSHVQAECEKWILETWLPQRYGGKFKKERRQMQNRGKFEFDAVNQAADIIGNISTAAAETYRGSIGSGKKSKLRADCLMLTLAEAQTKLMILTEPCMYQLAKKEQDAGRLPLDIILCHAELPDKLKTELHKAQDRASKEVRGSD